jgi:hypothetical protein
MENTDDLKEFAENCLDANEYGSLEYRLALAYLKTRANQRASEEVEVRQMWDELDHFWRWIERAYFDKTLGVDTCLNVLVHSPSAPWNVDREAWDTRHKSYDADIDKVVAETKARTSEVSPATVQDALDDVKFIRKELGRTWINQRQREVIEDIHARLHRIETALTHPREQQREDEGDVGDFHNAFWEAFKTLPEPIRKKFSMEVGRNFANTFYNLFKKV